VILTTVPPAVLPEVGLMELTVGAAVAVYVNWSLTLSDETAGAEAAENANRSAETRADVPAGVVTDISKVAAGPPAATPLSRVSEKTVNRAAATPPNNTLLAPLKAAARHLYDIAASRAAGHRADAADRRHRRCRVRVMIGGDDSRCPAWRRDLHVCAWATSRPSPSE